MGIDGASRDLAATRAEAKVRVYQVCLISELKMKGR